MELTVNNLSVCYKGSVALEPFTGSFQKGITCVLGENGSGKSTLIKALFLLAKSQGDVFFNQKKLDKNIILDHVSYLPQHVASNVNLNVIEVVLLGCYTKLGLKMNADLRRRAQSLLEALGISELSNKEIYKISGGQRKLVYLAQSLLKQPQVLLLDEPCNSLDIHNQLKLFNFINTLEEVIVIIAMHDINFTVRYTNKILLIKKGKVIFSGSVTNLTSTVINSLYNVASEEYFITKVKQYLMTSSSKSHT